MRSIVFLLMLCDLILLTFGFDRSKLSENSNKGAAQATPRVSKVSKVGSKSETESPPPLQNSRVSVERSPRSVNSKPPVERKSAKASSTPPDVSYRVHLVMPFFEIYSDFVSSLFPNGCTSTGFALFNCYFLNEDKEMYEMC